MSTPSEQKADKVVEDAQQTATTYALDWGSTFPEIRYQISTDLDAQNHPFHLLY
jgi:hypothetical protein